MDSDELDTNKPRVWGKRHTQIILMFLSSGVTMLLILSMSIAIVPMTAQSENSFVKVFDWSPKVQGAIFSSLYLGHLVCQMPTGLLVQKYGWKIPLTVTFFICTVCSLVFPVLSIWGGAYCACACRAILGGALSTITPVAVTFIGNWSPLSERDIMSTYCFIGGNLGNILISVSSGYLASTNTGWPLIFYVSGAVSGIVGILVALFGYSSPEQHPSISRYEFKYIMENRRAVGTEKPKKTPWRAILTSMPVWALTIANGACSWQYTTLSSLTPSYMKQFMGVNLKENGLLSALPFAAFCLCSALFGNLFSSLAKCGILSLTAARKIMCSIGMSIGGSLLICFTFVPANNVTVAITLMVVTIGVHSAASIAIMVNTVDIAPNFIGITSSIVFSSANIFSSLSPIVFGQIVTDETKQVLWQYGFCLSAGLMIFGNLIMIIFGTAEVQKWNQSAEISNNNGENAEEHKELNANREPDEID